MYKRKFANRREAYEYTAQRILAVKDPTALINNYIKVVRLLPLSLPTAEKHIPDITTYRAFDVNVGVAPYSEIIISEDGEISI